MSSSLRCTLFIFILFQFSLAFSVVEIINFSAQTYSRAAGPFFGDQNATIHTIYGGLSGACQTPSPSSVCNSCANANPNSSEPCNARKVHRNLRLGISIRSDQRGHVLVTNDLNDQQEPLEFFVNGVPNNPNNQQIFESNTTVLIEIPWAEICGLVDALDPNCEVASPNTSFSTNIRVGINNVPQGTPGGGTGGGGTSDNLLTTGEFERLRIVTGKMSSGQTKLCFKGEENNPEGVCNFIAYPGDKKIFLEEVYADCNFPSIGNSDSSVVALRVFYSTSLPYPNINSPDSSDIPIKKNTVSNCANDVQLVSLVDPIVEGLTNGIPHFFAIGMVDETTNVGFVTDMNQSIEDSTIPAATDNQSDKQLCFEKDSSDWPQNCHRAVPAEVIGLIQEEFDCFITTATYGSPFRPKVEDFRRFRNQFLKTHWLGRKVIHLYYKNSPQIAAWIRNHPGFKPVIRGILYPFWLFAKATLTWPLATFGLLLSCFLALVTLIFRKRILS